MSKHNCASVSTYSQSAVTRFLAMKSEENSASWCSAPPLDPRWVRPRVPPQVFSEREGPRSISVPARFEETVVEDETDHSTPVSHRADDFVVQVPVRWGQDRAFACDAQTRGKPQVQAIVGEVRDIPDEAQVCHSPEQFETVPRQATLFERWTSSCHSRSRKRPGRKPRPS
jgi:hypothetical protein